jgi:transcription initiation factor IIF auxiliary subunit
LPKAEKSELAAEPRVTPDRITTKNDFAPLRKRKGWYNWSVYLIADDDIKAQIESVTYTLHPTFPQPVRTVKDPSDGFRLRTSGWGEFQIKIDIHLKNGETISKYHWLNLGMGRLRSP